MSGKRAAHDAVYFDWRRFLDERDIPHRLYESRGWAELACPFCEEAPNKRHLGVRLDPNTPGWSCWKDPAHKGRRPERLLQALLGCTRLEAAGIVARQQLDQEEFTSKSGLGASQTGEGVYTPRPPSAELNWPPEMRILEGSYATPFLGYLLGRGLNDPQLVASIYSLRGCINGLFRWRLIIPVFDADGKLITWTGRSIKTNVAPKYYTLSHKPLPEQSLQAVVNIKEVIYNSQFLQAGGRVLVITEGPMDAIKVDYFGCARGVRATCLFGKVASPQQLAALSAAAPAFDRVAIILDTDAPADAWLLAEELRALCHTPIDVVQLPIDVKDPGELSEQQIREIF